MAVSCIAVTGATFAVLYRAAFDEQRNTLATLAWNYAKLVESVARYDAVHSLDFPGGPARATLSQIEEAHRNFKSVGHTGEIVLAKLEGNNMAFLVSRYQAQAGRFQSIPITSELGQPMRRALLGQSGTMVGIDYRGVTVLAAYEPIAGTNWGIVTKVDLEELRQPFMRAGMLALEIAIIVVLSGTILFLRITSPIIARLKEHSQNLTNLVESLQKSEDGLKKARDELEIRVMDRTEALSTANRLLAAEVSVRARAEERLQALWEIAGMVKADAKELCDTILQLTLQMTGSRYAFYGFLNQDESVMSIYSWSKEALGNCKMVGQPILYSLENAGLWAEAVRQRRDIVVNDYQAANPLKRGIPEGHVQLTRVVAVPVFGQGRIVSLVVAANKETDYDDADVKQLKAFASGVQMLINQREMETALRKSENECRLLSRQVIEAQESERKRVAREIHDGIGQSLAAIKYRVESNVLAAQGSAGAKVKETQTIVQMIRETMEEARRIHENLRPSYLDVMGILDTISDFCEKFQTTYASMKIDMVASVSEEEIPEPIKAPMFRIFQEAMNNAAKHSKADRVQVRIRRVENRIELAVNDNGIGLRARGDEEGNGRGRGMGLFSMEERANLSGGVFEVTSSPDKGTSLRVNWPLDFAKRTSGDFPADLDFHI
jgi:signal transduction histidine kinase